LNRKDDDFYPTPRYVTKALLKKEKFIGSILEPACGDGAICKVLWDKKLPIDDCFDTNPRGYGSQGDFLTYTGPCNNIITNPPYKLAEQFLLHAKKVTQRKIAFLLKTVFLEGKSRYNIFQDTKFPLKCIYQFSKRINFDQTKTSGMLAFAWFVWDRDWDREPVIRWINE
jgi:hypothetical protein